MRIVGRVKWLVLFLALGIMGCGERETWPIHSPTIIHLMVNGPRYDGERISVFGFIRLIPASDRDQLFLSCDALLNHDSLQGLFLRTTDEFMPEERARELDGRYVNVIGVFEDPMALNEIEYIEIAAMELERPSCFED